MIKNQNKSKKTSTKNNTKNENAIHYKVIPFYIIFGFIILISLYFISPLSNISTINVQGSNEIVDNRIIESSTIETGDPLWRTYLNRGDIEQKITNEIPEVSQVELSFSGVDHFTLNVEEYNTVAFLMNENEEEVKVLENGELVDNTSNVVGERPVLLNFDDEETFNQLIEQISQLDETILQLISEIENMEVERNPLLVRSYMNDGSQVIASIPTYAERISLYPQLVEAVDGQMGLFDLEAGAYFTPFSNSENMSDETLTDFGNQGESVEQEFNSGQNNEENISE